MFNNVSTNSQQGYKCCHVFRIYSRKALNLQRARWNSIFLTAGTYRTLANRNSIVLSRERVRCLLGEARAMIHITRRRGQHGGPLGLIPHNYWFNGTIRPCGNHGLMG